MNRKYVSLIEKAEELELSIATLYSKFGVHFPEDSFFWRELSLEEEHHAVLISNLLKLDFTSEALFAELFPESPALLDESLNRVTNVGEEWEQKPFSREKAFRSALEFEELAGEIHFQYTMTHSTRSAIIRTFQKLVGDNKDHFDRIKKYAIDKGIIQDNVA